MSAPSRSRVVATFLASWLLLLWPLLLNGGPFYSDDSGSYLRGGEFGFNTGLLILDNWWHSLTAPTGPAPAAGGDPNAIVASAIAESGGTRSVIYSVLSYVLRAPGISLLTLAIAQAGAVAFVLTIFQRVIASRASFRDRLAASAGVALLTPAAWHAAYAVPDILAGIAIAGAALLTIFFDRLAPILSLVLVLLIAFCITAHGSHLPVAFVTLLAGFAARIWLDRPSLASTFRRAILFLSPVAIAVIALLATSYIAFGELSLAPKRYPIQLARSVADGPGAWHLRDHCATERYAICEVLGANPPRDVGDFLWGKNGVRLRATPEQMERIRAEESTIVRRAALEYPMHQLRRSVTNTVQQFFAFGPDDLTFGLALVGRADPALVQSRPDRPVIKDVGKLLVYLSFAASVVALIGFRRRLQSTEVAAIGVVLVGLMANAAVCGILSAVTPRYQGRVAWVLPAIAVVVLLRLWSERRSSATST